MSSHARYDSRHATFICRFFLGYCYITLNVEYNKLFLLVFHTYIRQNPTTGIVYYSPCILLAIIKIHFIMTFYDVTQSLVKSSFFSIIVSAK